MTESSKPPLGRRMKTHAPPPPQAPQPAPRHIFRKTVPDGGGTSGVDAKENMLRPTVDLQLTLPQGCQISVTEDGSKALMDLLVELCSRYHLNPALHTLELLSPEGHPLGFKPNTLLGSLNVACVLIKEKVWEEKVVRRPAPKVPEKTVRLMVNYHGSQKAVVRVNPFVSLQALIPVICGKCEFDPAHVLLLKDSISRHELPLDRSLTELGIKELYVHDQSLVLQPKMASAPVLNYSDCIRSSTTTLERPEKKGLLGIFQFSRRKSKTETTSMDMDDSDDKVIQNTGTQSNGLSTVSGIPSVEDRPSTLGQSQSVMNIPRMSPKAETKKRRAPAPPGALTPMIGQTSFEGSQTGLGSESQQRKRKAPAPPPTPASVTPGSDDTSAAPTPDSHATKTPNPAFCTKVSVTVSSTNVVTQTTNPVSLKTTVQPQVVSHATPTASSPTPSNSTIDSLAVHDSSSELNHSFDDSDADLDQAGSHCSTLTSSSTSESEPAVKISNSRMEESEKSSSKVAKFDQEATSASSCRSETESALNLKLDEVENNRHSAMGTTDQPAPPKPPRSPALEPPQIFQPPVLSTPPLPCPPIEPTESNSPQSPMELEEAAPQSWLHFMQSSQTFGQIPETETPEEERLSLGSSSAPDKGYAVSHAMAEGEDSGVVSSPSDTHPTSPEGSLSLDGSSGSIGERLLGPVRDNSSDEGSATWQSRCRNNDISSQAKSSRLIKSYEEDPLTAQLHKTLPIEAGIAVFPDHIEIASAKKTLYTMSTDSNEVPVSVVDIDVPVTAIDDVLGDYEHDIAENEAKSVTGTESTGSKGPGFYQQPSMDPQNKNNNACTTSDSNKRCSEDSEQPSQLEQHLKLMENKATHDKNEEKMIQTKMKELSVTDTRGKDDKQRTTSAVKSNVDRQKQSESTELRPDPMKSNTHSFQEKKCDLTLTTCRSVTAERGEEMHRVFQNNSCSNSLTSYGKITRVTSRFGMKTFTVVPPKPSVTHASTGEPVGTLTAGAIKIDDQGNMVKVGMSRNKADDSLKSGINCKEESVLLGKAKAFWNSNERQEIAVPYGKGLIDKVKENTSSLKSTPTAILDTTLKTCNTDNIKTDKAQPEEMLKEETEEPVKGIQVAKEEEAEIESKFSVSKSFQPPSNKPSLPPPLFPDLKRDLSFLKPSRRTSSQYVASAITKCAPKTSIKLNSISNISDSSAPVKTHTISSHRLGQSMQVTPLESSQFSLSDNKETDSASKPNPPGPKRSVSYPEYVSERQRDFGEVGLDRKGFGSRARATKGTSDVLETETAKHMQSSGPIQINVTASNDRDYIKHIRPRSPTPAQTSLIQSSAKLSTNPKTLPQGQTSDIKDMTQTATHATPDVKPLHSVTVSNIGEAPATCGSLPVTVFGTVKKFRPVICGPVAKETSLHSSLMEAIQTGRGRDRLKKISTSGPSSMKKTSYVEEQNERSALMAAIRAPSNTERLRKTKSEVGAELEKFRKAASEKERSAHPPSYSTPPSLTSTSTVFIPPPPPAPIFAPPPPPPVLPKGNPSTVTQPSANTPMNPALAREAMLEAIRSGSAAERLKKVAVSTKTVHVNGRLGTIQPTSSTLLQQ